jgi:hypothetical protein
VSGALLLLLLHPAAAKKKKKAEEDQPRLTLLSRNLPVEVAPGAAIVVSVLARWDPAENAPHV